MLYNTVLHQYQALSALAIMRTPSNKRNTHILYSHAANVYVVELYCRGIQQIYFLKFPVANQEIFPPITQICNEWDWLLNFILIRSIFMQDGKPKIKRICLVCTKGACIHNVYDGKMSLEEYQIWLHRLEREVQKL